MASHEDARVVTSRNRRKFQPVVESTLERREVMTATGVPDVAVAVSSDTTTDTTGNSSSTDTSNTTDVSTTSADTPTPISYPTDMDPSIYETAGLGGVKRGANRPGATSVDWNTMSGWSWLNGSWKSNTKIDFMQTLAQAMGAKAVRFPSIPSMDTWIVGADSYVGRTALGAQQQTMPLDGLVIKPGGNSKVTTLSMTSADGTDPVELPLTSVKGNTATFTGNTPIIDSATGATSQTETGAPVRVNVTRRNASSMRITSEMYTGGKWTRMFTYTATKTRAAKV
jgi:hypothetical protein